MRCNMPIRPGARRDAGYSIAELLVVFAMAALVLGVGLSAWISTRRNVATVTAARQVHRYLTEARMLAVYRARNHFLVLNPATRTIEIYNDLGTTAGSFDNGDARVEADRWPAGVSLAFPPSVTTLANPLGGTALSSAWSLPVPNSSARWGSTLRGVMVTPTGRIQSAESTPATIAAGVMVLSNSRGEIASVGIRGQFGTVGSYQYLNSGWVGP